MRALLLVVFLAISTPLSAAEADRLIGVWELVSSQTVVEIGSPQNEFGVHPKGFLVLTRGGFCSLRPQIERYNISLEKLSDLGDLPKRLQAEMQTSETVVSWMGLIGAWCRKPAKTGTK